jgi:beta-lactamase class D
MRVCPRRYRIIEPRKGFRLDAMGMVEGALRPAASVRRRTVVWSLGLALAASGSTAPRAEGPIDLQSAFQRAFQGVEACVALRDVGPGAGTAVSGAETCERRLPPCATFDLAATVIALDRGVVPDAGAPVKRNPPAEGDPPDGVNLRDAFRKPAPWVFEEVARRIGSEAFTRSLAGMRYGNAEARGPVERIGRGEDARGLALSAIEQVDFLARLRRGELPTSGESQARTVEVVPTERVGDATIAWKTGACDGAAWAVGWLERAERNVIFASVVTGDEPPADDVVARTRRLMGNLALIPSPK